MGFDVLLSFVGVKIQMFVVHKEHIPANGHAAFDIVDLWIDGIAKDDDIAPFWSGARDEMSVPVEIWQYRNLQPWNMGCGDAVGELFDKEVIADEKRVFHAPTRDDKSLSDKEYDKEDYDDGTGPCIGPVIKFFEFFFQLPILCRAALMVLASSIAMVMGPTPPGTGVI